ncbi:MAG: hypothetical protein QM703_27160 [Gemmatales bacterium]
MYGHTLSRSEAGIALAKFSFWFSIIIYAMLIIAMIMPHLS